MHDETLNEEGPVKSEEFDIRGFDQDGDPEATRVAQSLVTVADAVAELPARWERAAAPLATGLRRLDHFLNGGVRAGDFVAAAGPAKSGKTALVGQLAHDLARAGALVIYASVEMPRHEMVSRWIARETFLEARVEGSHEPPIDHAAVLHGAAHRGVPGEGEVEAAARARVQLRLASAMRAVASVGARLFVEHLATGASIEVLRDIILRARAQTTHTGLTVLVVDPLERVFATERGPLYGEPLERANAQEAERLAIASQQLKELVDDAALNLAVVVASSTSSAASPLAHLATTLLDVAVAGARVDCVGNRRGAAGPLHVAFVPAAAAFVDRLVDESHDAPPRRAKRS